MLGRLTDSALRAAEDAQRAVTGAFEPSIRLGVTGLSRAGKTVFITALVAGLVARGRMTLLSAAAEGRIEAALPTPQPDADVPRFEYEAHLAKLAARPSQWPESTRQISEIRISLRYRSGRMLASWAETVTGPGVLHLDIVDYPGEWLLDLPLLSLKYRDWAAQAVAACRTPARAPYSGAFLAWLDTQNPAAPADEAAAREGAALFAAYLNACRDSGLSAAAPGRFLLPGDLAGSPAVTFAPVPADAPRAGTLARLMEDRFEAYKRRVVKPFFKNHFSKLDRQVVLVDALSAIDAGPQAVADLETAMADILACFRPGTNSWLTPFLGTRVERILFAATKADHIHHSQHARLTAILRALTAGAINRAQFSGAKVESMSIAALRATTEQMMMRGGEELGCVRGRLMDSGEEAALYPGELPENPDEIVAAAQAAARDVAGGAGWMGGDFRFMRFAPPRLSPRGDEGPPHIRLDRALEFLIGDRLA